MKRNRRGWEERELGGESALVNKTKVSKKVTAK